MQRGHSKVSGLLACFLLLAGFSLTGCNKAGPKGAIVEGTVTVDGKAANSGSVSFTDAKGQTLSGQIQPDGKYRVVGVAVGDAKVTVTGPPPGLSSPPPMKDAPGGAASGPPVPIPAKYAKVESSNLTFNVKAGDNTYPIALTK